MSEAKVRWIVVGLFLALFLIMVVMIANNPLTLAAPVFVNLSLGHLILLALHILPVVAAVIYIKLGNAPTNTPDNALDEPQS